MHINKSALIGRRAGRCGLANFSIMTSELAFGVARRFFVAGSCEVEGVASAGRFSSVFKANLKGMMSTNRLGGSDLSD